MSTGQTLLNLMELLNQELQLQSGEADVTRGLIAINAAQDTFEALLALERNALKGMSVTTVTTTASTETTVLPTGYLRIDKMQYIDPDTSRPAWDLVPIYDTGGHAWNVFWPQFYYANTGTGKPRQYYLSGSDIYWSPTPDATHTVRVYGFAPASDITAAGTFAYPDLTMLPLATLATHLMRLGVDDAITDHQELAANLFTPVMRALSKFKREQAPGYQYRYFHDS